MRVKFLILMACMNVVAADARAAVKLSAEVDGEQPAGQPLSIKVTLSNPDGDVVSWWCGGPDTYPPASAFVVEWRNSWDDIWHEVRATNGQYVQGSGGHQELRKGESFVVPLAVPLNEKADSVDVRITAREWKAAPVELNCRLDEDDDALAARHARMIRAVFPGASAFDQHFAEEYADQTVLDAMLKLVAIDNAPIVSGAARVLSRQKTLPEATGNTLAPLIALWAPRRSREMPGYYLINAGLKTQSEAARRVTLDLLRDSGDVRVCQGLVDALRLSPGNAAWVERCLLAIRPLVDSKTTDPELARAARHATEWLERRLELLRPPPDDQQDPPATQNATP